MNAIQKSMMNIESMKVLIEGHIRKVFEICSDGFSNKKTPLLADGVDLTTGEVMVWKGVIVSDFACQQNFLRAMDGFSIYSGKSEYRQKASEWVEFALKALRDTESGLLYWGGHACFDLATYKPVGYIHEFKCVYPYYGLLHKTDSRLTREFIEALWNKHVKNWTNLLMSRHGEYTQWNRACPWDHAYHPGKLPIVNDGKALSFINIGSDLIYAGVMLFLLEGEEKALHWSRRLAERYDDMRNQDTGLSGYMYNYIEFDRAKSSLRSPYNQLESVNEATILANYQIDIRYGRIPIVFMNLFEAMGMEKGQFLLDMVVKDLTAIARYSYDFSDHCFHSVLLDGTKLGPGDCVENPKYFTPKKLEKFKSNGLMFLAFSKAYCHTGNDLFWTMVESIAEGMGWGALGKNRNGHISGCSLISDVTILKRISPEPPENNSFMDSNQNDICALFGLLELYKYTKYMPYLEFAAKVSQRLLDENLKDGFFTCGEEVHNRPEYQWMNGFTRIDSALPLALLHLISAIEQKDVELPAFYPNFSYFHYK